MTDDNPWQKSANQHIWMMFIQPQTHSTLFFFLGSRRKIMLESLCGFHFYLHKPEYERSLQSQNNVSLFPDDVMFHIKGQIYSAGRLGVVSLGDIQKLVF